MWKVQNIYLQFRLRTLSNPYIQGSKALPIHKMAERVYKPSFIGSGIPPLKGRWLLDPYRACGNNSYCVSQSLAQLSQ